MREFIGRAATERPLLLVFEDLHWADESTLLLLEYLAPHLAEMPVLMVGTYRDVEVRMSSPLAGVLNQLVRERLGRDVPFVSRAIYTRCDEGEIAALLERVEHAHPGILIGSYPRFSDPDYSVKITFDGRDDAEVRAALEACLRELAPEKIVRAEV